MAALRRFNFRFFGRRHGVRDKNLRIIRPGDNIDLLSVDFRNDSRDSCALLAHAGTNGVNTFLVGSHRDFRARPGFAGNGLDFHGPGAYFGNLKFKKAGNHFRMRTRKRYAGTLRIRRNRQQIEFHTLANSVAFGRDLFFGG